MKDLLMVDQLCLSEINDLDDLHFKLINDLISFEKYKEKLNDLLVIE